MQAYEGREPYVFVSYAHKDAPQVLPVLEHLYRKGFRIWYDKGIEVGTEWPDYIAEHLENSACFVAFVSKNASDSPNCRQEIHFAIDLRKPFLVVYLEDVRLAPGLRMRLGPQQAMFRQHFISDASLGEAMAGAKLLQPCLGDFPAEDCFRWGLEYYRRGDFSDAVLWLRKGADQGNAQAQDLLGVCCYRGQGLEKDDAAAAVWFRQAAEQGCAASQCALAVLCRLGQGVPRDDREAAVWLRRAADQGDATAQNFLGVSYYNGAGVEQNPAEAVSWFHRSAEQGYAIAMNNLAGCYHYGTGVSQDILEAVNWYRRAAELGNAAAKETLTRLGYGEEQDNHQ